MIYILEDDSAIRELIVYTLGHQSLTGRGFEKPSDFWQAVSEELPQLILLDIMLPQEDGLSVLKRLRSNASTACIPVILLTAKSSEYDKVTGIEALGGIRYRKSACLPCKAPGPCGGSGDPADAQGIRVALLFAGKSRHRFEPGSDPAKNLGL